MARCRKGLLRAFTLLMALAMLIPTMAGAGETEKTVITILQPGSEESDILVPELNSTIKGTYGLKALLESKHPDVEIQFVHIPWLNWIPQTETTVSSGLCDIALYTNQVNLPNLYLSNDVLLANDTSTTEEDLYGLFEESATFYTRFHALQYPDFTGNYYGLPFSMYTPQIFFDKQLFDEWGVEYLNADSTYEEILEKAKQMTGTNPVTGEQNYGAYISPTWSEFYLVTFDALPEASIPEMDISQMDPAAYNFFGESQEVLDCFTWITDMIACSPAGVATGEGYQNWLTEDNNIGIMAFLSRTDNYTKLSVGGSQELLDRFVPIGMPLGATGKGYMPLNVHYAVTNTSKNPDKAWEVLKTLTTDKECIDEIILSGWVLEPYPAIKDKTGLACMELPGIQAVAGVRADAQFQTDDYWYWRQPALKVLNSLFSGEFTAEQARGELQSQVDAWIESVAAQHGK